MGLGSLVRHIGAVLTGAQTGRAYDYAGMFLAMLYIALLFASTVLLELSPTLAATSLPFVFENSAPRIKI